MTTLLCTLGGLGFAVGGERELVEPSLKVLSAYSVIESGTHTPSTFAIALRTVGRPHAREAALAPDAVRVIELSKYKGEKLLRIDSTIQHRRFLVPASSPVYSFSGNHLEIWFPSGGFSDRELMRAVRELYTRTHEQAGGVSLHAAALHHQPTDAGVLLVGPSGCGKTTVLLRCLEGSDRFGLIGNDRIVFVPGVGEVVGSPLPVRVSAGSVRGIARLQSFVSAGRFERQQSVDLDRFVACTSSSFESTPGTEGKLEFAPIEIAKLFGAAMKQRARLRAIVVPEFDPHQDVPAVTRLSTEQLLPVLSAECRTPEDPLWPDAWLVDRAGEPSRWSHTLDTIAAYPGWKLRFGPKASSCDIVACVDQLLGASKE